MITSSEEPSTELLLVKAVAEMRLEKPLEAFSTVVRILEKDSEHQAARVLLTDIGETLGSQNIFDYS